MERNRSGIQEQPNTFWTQCPFCSTKSQYHIEYLNEFLICQRCRNAFDAHELQDGVNQNETLKSKAGNNLIDLSAETLNYYDSDEEVRVLRFKPSNVAFGKRKRNEASSFACEICLEKKSGHESFGIKNCSHVFCTDCVVKYVDSKLEQNMASIGCLVPDCKGSLDPEHCLSMLKPEVFEKWGARCCEDVIVGSQKFYCPFKDCSAMLIDDGEEVVRESECPNCRRLFCAQCMVPWHAGITCEEFKRLKKDDMKMEKLAYKKHWRKCPRCGIYVEKTGGCSTIICRCGTRFSFFCGIWGCPFCGSKRKKGRKTMGFYVFLEEYRSFHRHYTKDTIGLVNELWRSMSRSERKDYENRAETDYNHV